MATTDSRKRVLIIGGGFAGIEAAKYLAKVPVDVTLIDRRSYFTFQPLLYQTALAVLSPSDITRPIRSIVAKFPNVEVLLEEVSEIDRASRTVKTVGGDSFLYDYLILATGSHTSYFGHNDWPEFAPPLKSITDALEIRTKLLLAFEQAELAVKRGAKTPELHFVVIGGGPTGVELAGAIADITRHVLAKDFRYIRPQDSKISLYEGGPTILSAFPPSLQEAGVRQLKDLGVTVHTGAQITSIGVDFVQVGNDRVQSTVTIWAAGVAPSPLGAKLGVLLDRKGAVIVDQFLNPEGASEIFVCGDLAAVTEGDRRIPAVAQPAMQMGKHAAHQIENDLTGRPRTPFHYFDKGDMATIGVKRAVARVVWPFKAQWSGRMAWLSWLFIHLAFLTGADRRISVLISWIYTYITRTTRSRIIVTPDTRSTQEIGKQH